MEPTDVVAVVMQNGPMLAVALLAAMAQACAAPIDPSLDEDALRGAFAQLKVAHVLAPYEMSDGAVANAAASVGAKMHYVVKDGHLAGLFRIVQEEGLSTSTEVSNGQAAASADNCAVELRTAHETVLLLRTSGTTATPKVVPLTLGGLVAGAHAIASGLGLMPGDRCLNVLPLTHIGGISCNLLGSLVSGGSVLCTAGFDLTKWQSWLVAAPAPTWYSEL